MAKRNLNPKACNEDRFGNNAAFCCPICGKIFVVSAFLKERGGLEGQRECPKCHRSVARVTKTEAVIEWSDSN